MNELSISGVLNSAWELTKKHGLIFAVLVLVYMGLCGGLGAAMGVGNQVNMGAETDPMVALSRLKESSILNLLTSVIGALASVYLFWGLLLCARDKVEGFTSEIFNLPLNVVGKCFFTYMIVEFVSGIGYCCCIVPGLYLMARLQFSVLIMLEHPELGIDEALKRSWAMTKTDAWTLVGLTLVCALVVLAGLLACCIGVCYTAIIANFAIVVAYIALTNRYEESSEI